MHKRVLKWRTLGSEPKDGWISETLTSFGMLRQRQVQIGGSGRIF